jgi:glyoxylase-like metal-dependent hydrolase (beta-lactamase superfamily II)
MLKHKTFIVLHTYETNTYLVWDEKSKEGILIDPAAPNGDLRDAIVELGVIVTRIINTHGHGDHIGGNAFFAKEFDCPICIHEKDAAMLGDPTLNLSAFMDINLRTPPAKILLKDGDKFMLGEYDLTILHTPGHTKGGICIHSHPLLFTGDTIFLTDVGRTDLPGGDTNELISSIKERILTLHEETMIFPGHGPSTTVGYERQANPYV